MEVEYNMYASLLKDAIVTLSLSSKEQVNLSPSGCLSCHLLKDVFFTYRDFKQHNHETVNENELDALDNIIHFMHKMEASDHVCFDFHCLQSANWQELRRLAMVARLLLDW